MRFIITIDRDLLEKTPEGQACSPILVEDTRSGNFVRANVVSFDGGQVVYGPHLQNGARVWVTVDGPVQVT